jgi:hypothetical protein
MMEAVASVGPSRERIEPGDGYCDACFTGRYPIDFRPGTVATLKRIVN